MSTDQVEFTFWHEEAVVARFTLGAGDFVVGRAESCGVIIDVEGMAPAQMRLRVGEEIWIENLDPQHGTLLARKPIRKPKLLRPGQEITFLHCAGTLKLEPAPVAAVEETGVVSLEAELAAAREALRAEQAQAAALVAEWKDREAAREREAEALRSAARSIEEKQATMLADLQGLQERWAAEKSRAAAAEREAHEATQAFEFERARIEERIAAGVVAAKVAAEAEAAERVELLRRELAGERAALEEEFRAAREHHEQEKENLEAELARAKTAPAPEPAEPVEPVRSRRSGSRDLLSLANKVLFKKLRAATGSEKDNEALRKELRQREIALVEAWTDRQRAEERAAKLDNQLARLEAGQSGLPEPPPRPQLSGLALGMAAAMLAAVVVLGFWLARASTRAREAETVVAVVRKAAPQFFLHAEESIADGRFKEALEQLGCAITLDPKSAEYRFAEGNVHESMLQIDAAASAYARTLQLNPAYPGAAPNLELCRRILGTRHGAASAETLYALHAMMMQQKRLPEALRMAQRLGSDRPLLQKTLSAMLEEARLPARLELNEDGTFDLDLSGPGRPDLSLLAQIPLRRLNLARSDVADLSPLKGIPLKRLDLAMTSVRDLSPLRGMPLETLDLSQTDVSNLFPLEGMPLRELVLDGTPVSDISMLRGMPLESVRLAGTRVRNLQSLEGSPLRSLDLSGTRVADLKPLQHLPIERLRLDHTEVVDLGPLAGAPLAVLTLTATEVADLRPLQKAPLRELAAGRCDKLRDLHPLTACPTLERLILPKQVTDIAFLKSMPGLRFLSYEKAGADAVYEQTAGDFWLAVKSK